MEDQFIIGSGDIAHHAEVELGALHLVGTCGNETPIEVKRSAPSDPELLYAMEVARKDLLYQREQRAVGVEMSTQEVIDAVLGKMS